MKRQDSFHPNAISPVVFSESRFPQKGIGTGAKPFKVTADHLTE